MAITPKANPQHKYVSGYNPIVFAADSDNKNLEGFRYIFDVYSAGTSDLLASYKIAPRFGDDGYGILSMEKVAQSFLSYNFNTDYSRLAKDSWCQFEVKVGESYGASWDYSGFTSYDNTASTYNTYVLLSGNTTHPYATGNQINIVQADEPNSYFEAISGLHTVVLVPNTTSIVIDIPIYGYTPSGITGTTTFANDTRAVYRDLYSFSAFTAFNGAVPFVDKFFDASQYVMSAGTGTAKFLTTFPRTGVSRRRTEDLFFNLIKSPTSVTSPSNLVIATSDGDLFSQTIGTTDPIVQMNVGPANITGTTLSGSQPVIKPTTTWYEIYTVSLTTTPKWSETIRIYIDDRCPIDYDDEEISICFLDRLGSMGSFAFPLRRYDNTNITRSTYNKQSGFITNGSWDYSLTENGTNIYNVDLKRTLTLNTDWLTEEDGIYFNELVTSPVTLIKYKGVYQRCDVVDTNTETILYRNKTLIRKTIQVNLSNPDNVNV